jgi:hypothetical protein
MKNEGGMKNAQSGRAMEYTISGEFARSVRLEYKQDESVWVKKS